jgi:exodeoxyribonuclease-3
MSVRIACWNVNSINARLPNVLDWLKRAQPDIVCLQELKCETHKFPREDIEALGYNCLVHGQKSYNGVAILSKYPIEEERNSLPSFAEGEGEIDEQSRYLEGVVSLPNGCAMRVICVYCPNGNPIDTPKFDYKLAWMDRLRSHVIELLKHEEQLVILGDWNIIPRPEDCFDPKAWQNDALFHPRSRQKWHELLHLGLTDAFMALDARGHQYTFWDYQGGAWPRDNGIHIDTLLLSPQAADKVRAIKIWRDEREAQKASDHVPVSADFET